MKAFSVALILGVISCSATLSPAVQAGQISTAAYTEFMAPPQIKTSKEEVVQSVANGDFFITANGRGARVGEGTEESTIWAMNFRRDNSEYRAFLDENPVILKSAILKVKLRGVGTAQHNDFLFILGLPDRIPTPNVEPEARLTASINLLDYYTGEEILDAVVNQHPRGMLIVGYADDAIVEGASLTLNYP